MTSRKRPKGINSNVKKHCDKPKPRPITNFEELAGFLGADWDKDKPLKENEERMSRSIYKGTACGAWLTLIPPGTRVTGKRYEDWLGIFARRQDGKPCLVQAAKANKEDPKATLTWLPPDQCPEGVRFFCEVEAGSPSAQGEWPMNITWGELVQVSVPHTMMGQRIGDLKEVVIEEKAPHTGGFVMGSIVEGTDAEVTGDEVYFPTDEAAVAAYVQWVEDEVQGIWDSTHGCPACFGGDGDSGRCGPVDPDCKVCGGEGIVI
jgi:hypothetical protein